ncbi:MAG TPA: acyltransferase [Rhodothermales bacterium]
MTRLGAQAVESSVPIRKDEVLGQPARLECLDALRGIAALVVFVQHAFSMFPMPERALLAGVFFRIEHRLFSGAAAVDLFFVLSGFVLTLPYVGARPKAMSYADFIVRRITRLYPAFWIAVAVALAMRLAFSDRLHAAALTEWTTMHWTAPLTATEVLRTLAMVLPVNGLALNTVFWSLIVEMQVSLLLPFFIVAIASTAGARGSALILAASVVISTTMADQSGLQFLPLFILGVTLARHRAGIAAALGVLPRRWIFPILGLSLALIEARAYVPWRFPDPRPEYMSGLGAGLLIMLVLARPRLSGWIVNPVTRLLGTASYSLYLLHLPIILAVVPPIHALTGSIILSVTVALILALGFAEFVYRTVEVPCQLSGRGLGKRAAQWTGRR